MQVPLQRTMNYSFAPKHTFKMAEALRVRVAPLNYKSMDTQCLMHWMPCKIAHSGDARVTEYFENSVRNVDDVCFSGKQGL